MVRNRLRQRALGREPHREPDARQRFGRGGGRRERGRSARHLPRPPRGSERPLPQSRGLALPGDGRRERRGRRGSLLHRGDARRCGRGRGPRSHPHLHRGTEVPVPERRGGALRGGAGGGVPGHARRDVERAGGRRRGRGPRFLSHALQEPLRPRPLPRRRGCVPEHGAAGGAGVRGRGALRRTLRTRVAGRRRGAARKGRGGRTLSERVQRGAWGRPGRGRGRRLSTRSLLLRGLSGRGRRAARRGSDGMGAGRPLRGPGCGRGPGPVRGERPAQPGSAVDQPGGRHLPPAAAPRAADDERLLDGGGFLGLRPGRGRGRVRARHAGAGFEGAEDAGSGVAGGAHPAGRGGRGAAGEPEHAAREPRRRDVGGDRASGGGGGVGLVVVGALRRRGSGRVRGSADSERPHPGPDGRGHPDPNSGGGSLRRAGVDAAVRCASAAQRRLSERGRAPVRGDGTVVGRGPGARRVARGGAGGFRRGRRLGRGREPA